MKKQLFISTAAALLVFAGLVTYTIYNGADNSNSTEPVVVSSLESPSTIDTTELPEPAEEIASSAKVAAPAPTTTKQTPVVEPVNDPADDKAAQCDALDAEFRNNMAQVGETMHYWQGMVSEHGEDILPKDDNGRPIKFYLSYAGLQMYYGKKFVDERQALGCYQ